MKTGHKFLQKIQKVVISRSVKMGVIILIALLGITGMCVFLLNFSFPKHTGRMSQSHKKHSFSASLPYTSSEDSTKILDKPIISSGCATPLSATPGTTTNVEITIQGKQRTYLLYLPPQFSNTKQHPLILSFHGYASNDRLQERVSEFNTIANTNDVIVVYPQGTTGVLAARGWNTGLHPTLNANDVLFVSDILNQLQANFCINPRQIYASGFSNGGGFVGELACQLSNRIAAFAPISGSYLTAFLSCKASRPVPIIEFHGTADSIVPYKGVSTLKEIATQLWLSTWAKKDGCDNTPTQTQESNHITKYEWLHCKDNAVIVHYKISGGHHTWPLQQFTQTIQGKIVSANAANLIWNFFAHHPLPRE